MQLQDHTTLGPGWCGIVALWKKKKIFLYNSLTFRNKFLPEILNATYFWRYLDILTGIVQHEPEQIQMADGEVLVKRTYPCVGIDIKCGKNTDFNYGPWVDRQRFVIHLQVKHYCRCNFWFLCTKLASWMCLIQTFLLTLIKFSLHHCKTGGLNLGGGTTVIPTCRNYLAPVVREGKVATHVTTSSSGIPSG